MALPLLGPIVDMVKTVLERVLPDPKAKADALQKLAELEQNGDLQVIANQVEINKIEAASPNLFIAGWRPAVGWVCAAGLAVSLVVGPLFAWGSALARHPMQQPSMPLDTTMALVTSMLGVAGMRTYEKLKGVESNR
jgi:hypothetical protein